MNVIVCAIGEFSKFPSLDRPTIETDAIAIGKDWVKAVEFGTEEGEKMLRECEAVVAQCEKLGPIVALAYELRLSEGIFVHPGKDPAPTNEKVRAALADVRAYSEFKQTGTDEEWEWFCSYAVGFSRGGNEPEFRIPSIGHILVFLELGPEATLADRLAAFEGLLKLPAEYQNFRLRDRAKKLAPLIIALLALISADIDAGLIFPDLPHLVQIAEEDFAREIGRESLEALRRVKAIAESGTEEVTPELAALIKEIIPKLRPTVEKVLLRPESVS